MQKLESIQSVDSDGSGCHMRPVIAFEVISNPEALYSLLESISQVMLSIEQSILP